MKRPVSWLVVLLITLAAAAPAWAQKQDPREVKARELFALGQYAEALDIYGKLYAETTHPTYMRNIGRCYQNMGEPDKAISSFREYLRQARDLGPDQRAQVEGYIREMEDLKRKRETAAAPATAPPAVGAPQAGGPTQAPAPVGGAMPALGAPPATATATAGGGTALDQPSSPATGSGRGSRRIAGYVVGGVSVAALGVGAVFGLRAISKRHESDGQCPMDLCTGQEGVTLNNEAKTAARVSDIAFGAGLVGAALATYLLVTSGGRDAPAAAHAARGLQLSPEVGPGEARLALGGSW